MVYTALYDIKGHEEAAGQNRPHGGKNQLEGGIIKGNWFERRERAKDFMDDEPTVLVVGAGTYEFCMNNPRVSIRRRLRKLETAHTAKRRLSGTVWFARSA